MCLTGGACRRGCGAVPGAAPHHRSHPDNRKEHAMSVSASPTDLAAFLAAPDHVVAAVAPATVIYAPSGTLRQAALAGVTHNDDYPRWILPQMIATIEMFFRLGVK